jgi:hypothetical protein
MLAERASAVAVASEYRGVQRPSGDVPLTTTLEI